MKIPIPELVVASVMALAMIASETGGVAGVNSTGVKTGERLTGTWTSYSPTKFGAMNAEFVGNGTCQFRKGAGGVIPCKWEETENGRAKIEATVSGGTEVFSATVTGDYLVVMEPGRETPYVRTDSKAAHERQQLVKGPSNFTIPW